jgi:hypothetical protein
MSSSSITLPNLMIDNVLDKACQGEDWNKLLQDIYAGTKTELEQLIGKSNEDDIDSWGNQHIRKKRFSDLSLTEQATIIDRQYYNMQQSKSKSLSNLGLIIGQTVDEELFKQIKSPNEIVIINNNKNNNNNNSIMSNESSELSSPVKRTMKESPSETTLPNIHPSNLHSLLDISSKAIIHALETSPPELGTTTKLFVNRPIPISLRPYIWYRSIVASQFQINTTPEVPISRVAGSLDVLLSRHIYSLLDTKFPEMSSRATSVFIKDIISRFLKIYDIPMPQREEDCTVVDQIFFNIIPLLFVLSSLDSMKELGGSSSKINYCNDTFALVEIESKMSFIGGSTATRPSDLITSSLCTILESSFFGTISPSKKLINSSPLLPRTLAILKGKNSALLNKLLHLRSSPSDKVASFKDFLNQQLLSGLSSFLSLETCLFIWDQGFITEFSIMLPLSLAALVLGASKEIEQLSSVHNVVDSLTSYCSDVNPFHLQKLLTTHCSSELLTVFVEEGSYQLAQNDEGLLQVLYQKLIPKEVVTKTNLNNKISPRTNNKNLKLAASKIKTSNILSPRNTQRNTPPRGPSNNPSNNQPPLGPNNNQPPRGPNNNQSPSGPNNNQPPRGPNNNQSPSGPNNNQSPRCPNNIQSPSGPNNNQSPSRPNNNQSPSGSNNNQPPRISNINNSAISKNGVNNNNINNTSNNNKEPDSQINNSTKNSPLSKPIPEINNNNNIIGNNNININNNNNNINNITNSPLSKTVV